MKETHQDLFLFGEADEACDWGHRIKSSRRGTQKIEELRQGTVESRLILPKGSNVVPRVETIRHREVSVVCLLVVEEKKPDIPKVVEKIWVEEWIDQVKLD